MANDKNYEVGSMQQPQRKGPMGKGHGPSFEKPKDFNGTIKKLLAYLKKSIPTIVVAIVLAAISAVLALVSPDLIKQLTNYITNGIITGIDLNAIARLGIILVAVYALSAIMQLLHGFIMSDVTQKLTKNMRTDISTKINRLPMSYYNTHTTGDILSRITNDADSVGVNLNQGISTLVTSICLLVGSLIMMFVTNWILALTAIAATFIGFFFIMIVMKKSQKYFKRQQEFLGKINGHIEETYAGHTVVKAYNAEKEMENIFEGYNVKLKKSTFMAQFLSSLMMPIMNFSNNFGYVSVCVVGAMLAFNGSIEFGVIVAFIIYVRLFTQPLTQIARAAQSMQSVAASGERIFDFLGSKEMIDESDKKLVDISNIKGKVEFKNVKFGYEDTDKIVINDFSSIAFPGQKIAIVGPTGAGKTTLVNLLMRFNEINSGDILIDDISIKDMTREQVHSLFCMVLQDTWLFEGTIKDNIIYSKKNVSFDEVVAACKMVGIDHYIKTLPKGYDTVLDDKTSLSQGQKQQITIARAIIENAPMLILDEATSSVDTRTEQKIQDAMDKMTVGRTSFVIAHRLSTIKNSDKILVLKDGDIVESGNHEELLQKGGAYAELYNSQFEQA